MSENERGTKSKYMTQAEGGILDDSEGYSPLTDGASEQGIFQIVGGYMDPDGVVHKEVHLRALSGHEEDLLSNDKIPFFQRITSIIAACTKRIGTIEDRSQVIKAIRGLPAGSRQHLLICLRRTSHWRTTKDMYEMKVECPSCSKDSDFQVDLSTLELYEMPKDNVRTFSGILPDSGVDYSWKITSFDQDEILSAVAQSEKNQSDLLTWSIAIRLESLNGSQITLRPADVIDRSTGKLLPKFGEKVLALKEEIKSMSTDDRQYLRDEFMENEPGIETDIDFACPHCKKEFVGQLNLGQRSFFFPSAARKRSNRRSFT